MLSAPIVILILAILAAVFGTIVAGPAGLIAGVVLLVVFAISLFRGKRDS